MSALFTSAVDTDVEGLKTTPKADPFEVLHKPKKPPGMAHQEGAAGGEACEGNC